jgi:hypothetical protein
MEELYLLLITNKASNIIQDIETLRLLAKGNPCVVCMSLCTMIIIMKCYEISSVVPDIAGATNSLNEEKITQKCFDLIFAFDEVRPIDYH